MGAKDNLLNYLKIKSISKNDFYKRTGLSNGFLDKNKNISSNNIEIIISSFSDLSLEWFITGKGNMLKKNDQFLDKSISVNNKIEHCLTCIEKDKLIKTQQKIIKNQQFTIDTQHELILLLQLKNNESKQQIQKQQTIKLANSQ